MEDYREVCVTILRGAAADINVLTDKLAVGAEDMTGRGVNDAILAIEQSITGAVRLWCGKRTFERRMGDLVVKE